MSKLIAVCYRLLEHVEPVFPAADRGEPHDFDGELRLDFDDGRSCFVSWVSEPVQYCVGTGERSHFLPGVLANHDVSASTMWAGLVGREVAMTFIGADQQMLAFTAGNERVLACSFERGHWWADAVTICREMSPAYEA